MSLTTDSVWTQLFAFLTEDDAKRPSACAPGAPLIEFLSKQVLVHPYLDLYRSLTVDKDQLSIECDDNVLYQLATVLESVRLFLLQAETAPFLLIKGDVQVQRTMTFAEMLKRIARHHWHRITVPPAGEYTCGFHDESLIEHLMLATVISVVEAIRTYPDYGMNKLTQLGITAILHDIGKPACASGLVLQGGIQGMQYPFHGEMAAGILVQAYNPISFSPWFTAQVDWENVVTTCARHMCGYHVHEAKSNEAKFKWSLLGAIENDIVKQRLQFLGVGDTFAAIPHDADLVKADRDSKLAFLDSRPAFCTALYATSQVDMLRTWLSIQRRQNLAIFTCGSSASGKSTLGRQLVEYINQECDAPHLAEMVSRDVVLTEITQQFWVETYFARHPEAMNEWERLVESDVIKQCFLRTLPKYPSSYSQCYKVYETNKKVLARRVNDEMKARIDAILVRRGIPVIDTVANLYAGIDTMVPLRIKHCFKIAVDVLRSQPITQEDANRLGQTKAKQIELFGERDELCWLPAFVRGETRVTSGRLHALASLSTASNIMRAQDTLTRPHLRFAVGWDIGRAPLFRTIDLLLTAHYREWGCGTATTVNSISESLASNSLDEVKQHEQLSEEEDVTLDIVTLVKRLDKQIGWINIPAWFKTRAFRSSLQYDQQMLSIKYMECNRMWKPLWARQCRGIVFFKDSLDGRITCLKSLLMRGSEVTVDGRFGDRQELDADQLETVAWLAEEGEYARDKSSKLKTEVALSNKVDGSLLGVTLIPKTSERLCQALADLLDKHGDEFNHAVWKRCDVLPFRILLSSQATSFIKSDMHPWTATAILEGLCEVSRNTLTGGKDLAVADPTVLSPTQALEQHGTVFFDRLVEFWTSAMTATQRQYLTSLSFETVCANRTSAWGDHHVELATSYPRSMLQLLGVTFNISDTDAGTYAPHFAVPEAASLFSQPYVWFVHRGHEARDMVLGIDRLMLKPGVAMVEGDNTVAEATWDEAEFFTRFPPTGPGVKELYGMDLEGFIALRRMETGRWCYSKLKTQCFYRTHCLRKENAHYLLNEVNDCGRRHFPLVDKLHTFVEQFPSKFASFARAFFARVEAERECMMSEFDDRMRMAFDKRSRDVQWKMLVTQSRKWRTILFQELDIAFGYALCAELERKNRLPKSKTGRGGDSSTNDKSGLRDDEKLSHCLRAIVFDCLPSLVHSEKSASEIEADLITKLGELVQQAHASQKGCDASPVTLAFCLIQSVLPASARAVL